MRDLQRDKYVLRLNQIPPKMEKLWCTFLPLRNWIGAGYSRLIYLFLNKIFMENMHQKMSAFSYVLWCLLVPLCTVFSETSLHCTICDLHHPSAINNVYTLQKMVLFSILYDIICTYVVSIILTIMSEAVSNNLHVSFITAPLLSPVPIVHHTICYPHLHFLSST